MATNMSVTEVLLSDMRKILDEDRRIRYRHIEKNLEFNSFDSEKSSACVKILLPLGATQHD